MSEAMDRQPLLACTGLTKRFTEGRLDVTVLRGIDLQVQRGDTVAVGVVYMRDRPMAHLEPGRSVSSLQR